MKNGESDSKRYQTADLEVTARNLQNDSGTTASVPVVVTSGVTVAFIVPSFAYAWPLWISLELIVLLGAVVVVSYTHKPPVAPLELTQGKRGRVRRVLSEHGIHPVATLVRALYPEESPAVTARTVKLPFGRAFMEQGDQDRRGQHLVVGFLQKLVVLPKRGTSSTLRCRPRARLIGYE